MSTLPERPTTPIWLTAGLWIAGILIITLVIWWIISTVIAAIKLVAVVAILGAIVYALSRRR